MDDNLIPSIPESQEPAIDLKPSPADADPEESTVVVQPRKASEYNELVDWERRLAREEGFFRRLFQSVSALRVADVGCGTGRHAVMFAKWGLDVVAIDPSAEMLDEAVAHAKDNADAIIGAGGRLEFVEAGFGDVAKVVAPDRVDAIICTGNTLPRVDGHDGLRTALRDFAEALRPGGALALHFLNHTRLLQKRPAFLPPSVRETPEGRKLFIKLVDYPDSEEPITFDFLTVSEAPGDTWKTTVRSDPHTALPVDFVTSALVRAGFDVQETLGGHDGRRLELLEDESALIAARRRRHLRA